MVFVRSGCPGLRLSALAPALLSLSVEIAASTLQLSKANDAHLLLNGLQQTDGQLADRLAPTTHTLLEGLEQTANQVGDGLREMLDRLVGGSAALLLRLNGRYVETVDGSEALEIAVVHRGLGRRVVILRPTAVSMTPASA